VAKKDKTTEGGVHFLHLLRVFIGHHRLSRLRRFLSVFLSTSRTGFELIAAGGTSPSPTYDSADSAFFLGGIHFRPLNPFFPVF
jgi:hypothetical protein